MMMDGCDVGGVVVTHIFVLFLLKLIFHGFRLTYETTQTCVSLVSNAGIEFLDTRAFVFGDK